VTATSGGHVVARVRVPPAEQRVLHVPLHADAKRECTVRFTTGYVRVPANVQPDSTDTRPLGAHYYAFDFTP